MPKYNFKCSLCEAINEIIVSQPMSEGEFILDDCEGCGKTGIMVKIPNQGNVSLSGCTLPGENG